MTLFVALDNFDHYVLHHRYWWFCLFLVKFFWPD